MLVQVDRDELGDKRLSPEESIYRETEELLKLASTRKIGGQEELEDQERSAGPRIHFTDFIRRVHKFNSGVLVVEGMAGSVALYILKPYTEWNQDDTGHRYPNHKYVGGLEKQRLPEFSHVILDTSNLPIREYRGWRSVLIALVKNGVLSYNEAIQAFGEPVGRRGDRWFQQLREHKFYSNKRFTKGDN